MIEEARSFEHSGPYLALLKLGLEHEAAHPVRDPDQRVRRAVGPGLRRQPRSRWLLAIAALLGKARCSASVVAVIDDSFAKLRLFKITEFVVSGVPAGGARRCSRCYLGGG